MTRFMRKGCERRRLSEIGIAGKVDDLSAMEECPMAMAPELFYQICIICVAG